MKNYSGILFFLSFLTVLATGCHPGAPEQIPYNEDSAKAQVIPLTQAIRYTSYFRAMRDTFNAKCAGLRDSMSFGKAEAFNRDAIALLLNQKDSSGKPAAGIRIYYGLDAKGMIRQVLVPYDQSGNDIVNQLIAPPREAPGVTPIQFVSEGQAVENGQRCPTICGGSSSGLNGTN